MMYMKLLARFLPLCSTNTGMKIQFTSKSAEVATVLVRIQLFGMCLRYLQLLSDFLHEEIMKFKFRVVDEGFSEVSDINL